jgi:hypothetical protein
MLRGDADRHKERWLMLVATLMLVLFGIAFAMYALHHRPIQRSNKQSVDNRSNELTLGPGGWHMPFIAPTISFGFVTGEFRRLAGIFLALVAVMMVFRGAAFVERVLRRKLVRRC